MNVNELSQQSFPPAAEVTPNLEFTGERIVPGKTGESLFREHEERYVFAGQYVVGKDVLDVACGTGIGTAYLLKARARSCMGVDIDQGAIDYAKAAYPGCLFIRSDAMNLNLPDRSLDVVVSFETIEHLEDQRGFLMICNRILRPGGIFMVSTPNRTLSCWEKKNPFHLRELTFIEFRELIGSVFADVQMYSQKKQIYALYACRKVFGRTLDQLGLGKPARRLLRREPAMVTPKAEFMRGSNDLDGEIQQCREPLLRQPMFMIAVTRKDR